MFRYSYIIPLSAVLVVAIGGLISLNFTPTSTWAQGTHVHNGQAHTHGAQAGQAHSQGNTVTLTDKAKVNIGLKTDEADIRAIETVVDVHGNVMAHPRRQAIVTPRIGGIVKRVHFSVGETPKKGDVLLELESLDLQMAQIELLEAASQQQSLVSKLARLTEVFAKQIRRELQTRQIDYLQSLSELKQLHMTLEKRKNLAVTQTASALEQMRFRLIKADVEHQLLETTLKRIKTLAEKRISAQKELIAKQAAYKKAQNELADAKRQFQILGISEQTLEKILRDNGEASILSLLGIDELDSRDEATSPLRDEATSPLRDEATSPLLEKYAVLSEESTRLVDAEAAYQLAAIKVVSNKQRALAAGLTETLLETLAETGAIASFDNLSTEALIENYLAFVESSEALEGVLLLEEKLRNADITLNKVRQKLQVSGLTADDIDKVIQTGQPSAMFSVKAPASGQITQQHVTVGTTVSKSDVLFSILDTDVVWVQGEVHEDTLALIHDKWQIGSEVRIRVDAYPEAIYTGKISGISDVVEPEEQTVHFWAEIENPNHQLKPGMFADQTIVLEQGTDVLSVPLEAVIEDGGSRFVFVAYGATYTKHEIVVGTKDDRYIEVKEGLLPGELVVVQGTHQLISALATSSQVVDPYAGHGHPH